MFVLSVLSSFINVIVSILCYMFVYLRMLQNESFRSGFGNFSIFNLLFYLYFEKLFYEDVTFIVLFLLIKYMKI